MINLQFISSAVVVASVCGLVSACGSNSQVGNQGEEGSSTEAVPAPFPVVTTPTIGGVANVRVVYKGITRNYPVSFFKAYLLDSPCGSNSLPMQPNPGIRSGSFISATKVNTIAGTPTSGHVAVAINFEYCVASTYTGVFALQPSPTGNHVWKVVKLPRQRPVSNAPLTLPPASPLNHTYSVDTVTSMAFTTLGKLKINLANPPGSTGFYIYTNTVTANNPVGTFQFCTSTLNAGGPIC
jgi:hypothetical protein